MRLRQIVFPALLAVVIGFGSCAGDSATDPIVIEPHDSVALDSTMPAHVQDPSTAFPRPPVTGTKEDSSRTQDSVK